MLNKALSFALLVSLQTQMACVPAFLDKYKREEVRNSQQKNPAKPPVASASGAGTSAQTPTNPAASRRAAASIVQIADGVFRVPMTYDRTWDAVVDVLLRNYNLQIVEKNTGILTTEWDSYYLDGKVHRNKVSLRLKRLGNRGVDLTVHNNVEILSRVPDGVSEVWLPSDRTKPEIGRIVQNLAIQTGQPKPSLTAEYNPTTGTDKAAPPAVR